MGALFVPLLLPYHYMIVMLAPSLSLSLSLSIYLSIYLSIRTFRAPRLWPQYFIVEFSLSKRHRDDI